MRKQYVDTLDRKGKGNVLTKCEKLNSCSECSKTSVGQRWNDVGEVGIRRGVRVKVGLERLVLGSRGKKCGIFLPVVLKKVRKSKQMFVEHRDEKK